MKLHLSIDGEDGLEDGLPASYTLEEFGAVIGRSRNCSWCVPDKTVSSRHCEISWQDGYYWLTDSGSTNGTFVNGKDLRGRPPHALQDGDHVTLGSCQVSLAFEGGARRAEPAQRAEEPWTGGLWNEDAPRAAAPHAPTPPTPGWAQEPEVSKDRRAWASSLGQAPPAYTPPPPGMQGPGRGDDPLGVGDRRGAGGPGWEPPPLQTQPASAEAGRADPWAAFFNSNRLPDDSALLTPSPPPVSHSAPRYVPGETYAPEGVPAAPPPPPAPSELAWAAFLDAAGVNPEDLKGKPTEAAAAAGAALADMTDGLMRMMQARAKAKQQLGAISTSFVENPLKVPMDSRVVTTQLLNPPTSGFLAADVAIAQAFADLQAHQMATLAAMQRALRATLERFSPREIEARAGARGGIFPGSRSAALWKAYTREFDGVAEGSDEAFLDVFAKAFRRAYDEHSQ